MNQANFTNPGQLSFTQNVLDFLQSAYSSVIAGICEAIGGNAIISGCTVNNGSRSSGVILLNGEILPFAGGIDLANFAVQDVTGTRPYYDGSNKIFYHTRTAVMTATGGTPVTEFVRIKNLAAFAKLPTDWTDDFTTTPDAGVLATMKAVNDAIAAIDMPGGVPKGGIMMWSGAVSEVPDGWALCDGDNDTPDLRDKFILVAGNQYPVGAQGGEAAHILTPSEMPAHHHMNGVSDDKPLGGDQSIFVRGQSPQPSNTYAKGNVANTGGNALYEGITDTVGGGLAHNNLPPYYALAFIMKT